MTFHIFVGPFDGRFHYDDGRCFTCGHAVPPEVFALKPAGAMDVVGENVIYLGPVCPECSSVWGCPPRCRSRGSDRRSS